MQSGVGIDLGGRGRWMENVFIERLWRSLKYECVYLNAFETGSQARIGIARWVGYYNAERAQVQVVVAPVDASGHQCRITEHHV